MPSGDHEGVLSEALSFVNLVRPVPSSLITYISQLPSRLDMKAILDAHAPLGQTCQHQQHGGHKANLHGSSLQAGSPLLDLYSLLLMESRIRKVPLIQKRLRLGRNTRP